MKETELKPCPFCGSSELKLLDFTDRVYGFDGYAIRCKCGCRLESDTPHEHYFEGTRYCTPMTERAKKNALKGLYESWNRRTADEQR